MCYAPQGTFYALSIGQSSSFTGLNLTHSYNSRLQPSEFKASSTGGNAIDITYNFVDSVTGKNAGLVYGITNNLDTTRSQTFSYDQLNRITAAQTTSTFATSPSHCWGESYNLDPWGNLQSLAGGTSQYTGCTYETGFTKTADANNHLSGFSYDTSGNTTADGFNTYTWDAESQLKVTAGSTYLYDGDGRRVAKANTAVPPVPNKLYWYGSGDEVLAETDASGNTTAEYIFFGGKRIAMIPSSGVPAVAGNPIYYVEDLLGTSRVITTNTGVVCYDADFYPYGGERAPYTNTCTQNNYKFEGKERDTETGNDDFGARYYSNRFGRWLSADWSAVPVPVPYANLTNPQTLNLYAMASDDPESFADLDGHDPQQGSAPNPDPTSRPCPAGSVGTCNPPADMRPTGTNNQAAANQAADGSFWQTVNETAQGAVSAWAKDNGAPLEEQGNDVGRALGHIGATVQGLFEMVQGGTVAVLGGAEAVAASPTVVGSAPGVVAAAAGTAEVIHGGAVLKNALGNAAKEGSSGGPSAGRRATEAERARALKENAGNCVFCGKPNEHVDHAIARSKNGNNTPENLQGTCAHCNLSKGVKSTIEFIQWLGSKL